VGGDLFLECGTDAFYTVQSGERSEGSVCCAISDDALGKRRTYPRERLDRRGGCNVDVDEEPRIRASTDRSGIRFGFRTCTRRCGLDAKRGDFLRLRQYQRA